MSAASRSRKPSPAAHARLAAAEAADWRDPAQIVSQWKDASDIDPRLLEHEVDGDWWETLAACGVTLLVTREYEHLVMALAPEPRGKGGAVSYLRLPHPSGLAVDRERRAVYVAATRNPNQVFELRTVQGALPRADTKPVRLATAPVLIPAQSRFYPGCLYMHDLAMIDGILHTNAVGQNAVVRLDADGAHPRVWWPKCIEENGMRPHLNGDAFPFGLNYLQLNSIAAGPGVESSYFSASTDRISRRRPGHLNFPVNKRGVIFSGRTREPVVRGLTRPHSARLHNDSVWVDNSGYGELGFGASDGTLTVAAKLPGWTRGLCFHGNIAFVGTSRVIPRYAHYAPGLDAARSICGIHAVEITSGKILGSLRWLWGNQIFAIDWMPRSELGGFAAVVGKPVDQDMMRRFFYSFSFHQKGS